MRNTIKKSFVLMLSIGVELLCTASESQAKIVKDNTKKPVTVQKSVSIDFNDLLDDIATRKLKPTTEYEIKGRLSTKTVGLETSKTHIKVKPSISGSISSSVSRIKTPCVGLYCLLENATGQRLLKTYCCNEAGRKYGWRRAEGKNAARNTSIQGQEIDKEQWRSFKLGNICEFEFWKDLGIKLVCYRIELWHDGRILDSYESMSTRRRSRLGLPDDWYIKGKYPQKMNYSNFGFEPK